MRTRAPMLLVGLLAALAALAAPVRAGGVEGVTPSVASTGTELVVSGSGFGAKAPRVLLVPVGGGKTRKAKVLEHSDTTLLVRVRKAQVGLHDLVVRPRGGAPELVQRGAVDVRPPEALTLLDDCAGPGDEVLVLGAHLGTKKGRVRVGGRKAKVLEWSASAGGEGEVGAVGSVRFRVPKKAGGPETLEVSNRLGAAELEPLWVLETDPAGPGEGAALSGTFDGAAVELLADGLEVSTPPGVLDVLAPGPAGESLGFRLAYDVTVEGPAVIEGLDVLAFTWQRDGEIFVVELDDELSSSGRVDVDANCNGVVTGRFSGELVRRLDGERIPVTDGRFQIPWGG